MQCVTLCHVFLYAGVGFAEKSFIEILAETLASLCDFLLNLVVHLGNLLLDQHIGAITLLGVAIVDQRVVECVNVSRRFPYRRVHEDSRVDAHDVFVKQCHGIPPITLDVILQLHAVLTVVVNSRKSIVYFAGREHKAVFFGM